MPCQYASDAQMARQFDELTFLPLDCDRGAFPLVDLVLTMASSHSWSLFPLQMAYRAHCFIANKSLDLP